MVIWYCEPNLFLFPPITRKRDTLHRYWDLSLFLLTEKMKTAILALKGALKSKSVDQGSFKVKTVKQKSSNTWKEVKTFNSKIFKDFIQTGTRLSLAHFLITRTMCSTWNWSCTSLLFNFYFIFSKFVNFPCISRFLILILHFWRRDVWTVKWYSNGAWNSNKEYRSIAQCQIGRGGGTKKMCPKPSGCHEFICLLSLFVAYCILVFACNEVFVFAADQRERFVCWRLIPAPFSFPHHHIVIRQQRLHTYAGYWQWYYNISIDIVMLLLNVDPKTPSHCHMDLACRRNFVSKSCFSCHRINQLTIKPLEKTLPVGFECSSVSGWYLPTLVGLLFQRWSSEKEQASFLHLMVWYISHQNLCQPFYHDNHHHHPNHHNDDHHHHHSNHLKETNSSPSLAFPVLWVRVQSLQHVKRLVVKWWWCWRRWWWWCWRRWRWWCQTPGRDHDDGDEDYIMIWMRWLISMCYDHDKHLRRMWFWEQFLFCNISGKQYWNQGERKVNQINGSTLHKNSRHNNDAFHWDHFGCFIICDEKNTKN